MKEFENFSKTQESSKVNYHPIKLKAGNKIKSDIVKKGLVIGILLVFISISCIPTNANVVENNSNHIDNDFINDINHFLYIVACDDLQSVNRHFKNLDRILKKHKNTKIIFITTNLVQHLSLEIKQLLFAEAKKRESIILLISIGDVYRTLENAIYKIVKDMLEQREKQTIK